MLKPMWEKQKIIVLKAARQLAGLGMVIGSQGNMSLRFRNKNDRHLIAITPSSIYYETLEGDDIVIIDNSGKTVAGHLRPSTETNLHLSVYENHKEVNAILHVHSEFISILAVAGLKIPPILDDQVVYLGGEILIANYALPGTRELAENVLSSLCNKRAVILAHHGGIVTGKQMKEALFNCQLLERIAQAYVYSKLLSIKVKKLPNSALAKEIKLYYAGYAEGKTG